MVFFTPFRLVGSALKRVYLICAFGALRVRRGAAGGALRCA